MHTAYRMTIRLFGTLTSGRRSTPTVSAIFGVAAKTKATPSLVSEAFCFQEHLAVDLHKFTYVKVRGIGSMCLHLKVRGIGSMCLHLKVRGIGSMCLNMKVRGIGSIHVLTREINYGLGLCAYT